MPGIDHTTSEVTTGRRIVRSRPDAWIIVCEDFHGAVGPIPTERLAVGLAAYASKIGGCTYRPVRFALASRGGTSRGKGPAEGRHGGRA